MTEKKADLHLHSYYSDGKLSPAELIGECKNFGLEIVSLTDHDTTRGIKEAQRAGSQLKLKVVPGIELSTDYNGQEYHLLGYLIDFYNEDLQKFTDFWQRTKLDQIRKMTEKLQELGFSIDYENMVSSAKGSVNRPHISNAVFQRPENQPLLEKLGLRTTGEFFRKFLKDDKVSESSVYVERERPLIEAAIALIRRVGGIPVWAHPLWRDHSPEKVKEKAEIFKDFGLGGIEVCYPFHNEEETKSLHQIAKELVLFETCGSDFHSKGMDMLNQIASYEMFGLEIDLSWIEERFREVEGGL